MKVIDLLNKIANGEEVPKVIEYENEKFTFTGYDSASKNYNNELEDLFEVLNGSMLNDEVEILEEEKKIPEKLKVHGLGNKDENGNYVMSAFPTNEELMNKINEIIDYLKGKGEQ